MMKHGLAWPYGSCISNFMRNYQTDTIMTCLCSYQQRIRISLPIIGLYITQLCITKAQRTSWQRGQNTWRTRDLGGLL